MQYNFFIKKYVILGVRPAHKPTEKRERRAPLSGARPPASRARSSVDLWTAFGIGLGENGSFRANMEGGFERGRVSSVSGRHPQGRDLGLGAKSARTARRVTPATETSLLRYWLYDRAFVLLKLMLFPWRFAGFSPDVSDCSGCGCGSGCLSANATLGFIPDLKKTKSGFVLRNIRET